MSLRGRLRRVSMAVAVLTLAAGRAQADPANAYGDAFAEAAAETLIGAAFLGGVAGLGGVTAIAVEKGVEGNVGAAGMALGLAGSITTMGAGVLGVLIHTNQSDVDPVVPLVVGTLALVAATGGMAMMGLAEAPPPEPTTTGVAELRSGPGSRPVTVSVALSPLGAAALTLRW